MTDTKAQKAVSKTTDSAQKIVDEVDEKGYFGVSADPTPDAHYTVDGVTSGKPTPETDSGSAAKAVEYQHNL